MTRRVMEKMYRESLPWFGGLLFALLLWPINYVPGTNCDIALHYLHLPQKSQPK